MHLSNLLERDISRKELEKIMEDEYNVDKVSIAMNDKIPKITFRGIGKWLIMTRCNLLNTWFDAKSKELDKAEKEKNKDLITGEKKWVGKT